MSAMLSPTLNRQEAPAATALTPQSFRGGVSETGRVQCASLQVSSPHDSAEREASDVARRVVQMPAPAAASVRTTSPRLLARASASSAGATLLQREGEGPAAVDGQTTARIQASRGGGQPLSAPLRRFMEPRFGADFSRVRIHTDAQAQQLSQRLDARAFTTGRDIYFNAGQYAPDTASGRELIAHELAHTIQQGESPRAVQRSELTSGPTPAEQLSPARGEVVHRLGLSDILDGLAELAANVPGYTLLTLIIGRNPINMRVVERNVVNILRAFIGLIPGGEIMFQVLQRQGIVTRVADWVGQQTAALGLNFQTIRDAFTRFTDSLSWTDIFSPGDVWRRARATFTPLIDRVTGFVSQLISQAITWLKETFMTPLSDFCRQIPGYGLVTVLLGRDPFTGAAVPRTAMNVVRAFAEFIPGGTEKVDQLVQSGALERAYAWFQQETSSRNLTWDRVAGTFTAAWASLQLSDVLHPIETIQRIVGQFRPLMSDLVGFAGAALMKLLELIYEAAMGAGGRRILSILTRVRATFVTIIQNPVGFLRNLLGAVGQGVRQFMTRILTHLRDGVIAWLTGPVARAGIQMPERWDLQGIVWFVLQILGLSWQRVRQKLVTLIGEPAMAAMERGLQFIRDVRDRGLVATLRERVTEFFGNLRESALGAIKGFIQQRLVQAGIQQLLSLLSPVGAVIQAIIKTYTTIQFFIQRINQIMDLVESILDSVSAIASGAIGAAANFVERTMARTIPVILDFLARFIGLGDVGAQVQTTIRNLQGGVDRMLDRAIEWIRRQAGNLASRLMGGDPSAPPQQRLQSAVREGVAAVNRLSGSRIGIAVIRPVLAVIRTRHQLRSLEAEARNGKWAVVGVVNPTLAELTQKDAEAADAAVTVSAPQYFPSRNPLGWGTGMVAIRRSGGLAGGSDVGTTNNHFDDLNIRRHGDATSTSTASYYVLGHLLNQELGGPGNQWGNLTPLSRSGNGLHETRVESQVKGKVAAGKVIRYEVRVVYGRSASPLLAQTPANSTNPVIINKRKILLKEQHVASALDCRAVEWDLGTNQAKAGGWSMTPTAVPNPVDATSLSDYNVPGQAALRLQTLAINDSIRALSDPARSAEHAMHTAALQSLPGIGPARFDALKARSYRTWEDFWSTVPGVTQDTTNAWRAGLPGGARVILNGTTTWI